MLEQKLNELEQSDIYPFHMPGHKRAFLPFANPYAIDITEIEGFDNLHHATGILQEAQQKAADLYGAKKYPSVFIHITAVSRVEPAVFLQYGRGRFRIPVIAKHDIFPAGNDFSASVFILVDNFHLNARHRGPYGGVRISGIAAHAQDRRTFRQTISLPELEAHPVHIFRNFRIHGRRAGDDQAQPSAKRLMYLPEHFSPRF